MDSLGDIEMTVIPHDPVVDPLGDIELTVIPHHLHIGKDSIGGTSGAEDTIAHIKSVPTPDVIKPPSLSKDASCHLVDLAAISLLPPSSPSPAQVLSLGSKGDIPSPQLYELLMGSEGDVDDHHVITPYHHLKPKSLMSVVDIISSSTPSQLYVQ